MMAVIQETKNDAEAVERIWAEWHFSTASDPVKRQEVAAKVTNGTATAEEQRSARGHHGVATVAAPKAIVVKGEMVAMGGRLIWAELRAQRSWVVVSAHAPHAAASDRDKKEFSANSGELYPKKSRRRIVLIGGDLNVKLGSRRQGEERWFGEHCGPEVPGRGDYGAAARAVLGDNGRGSCPCENMALWWLIRCPIRGIEAR